MTLNDLERHNSPYFRSLQRSPGPIAAFKGLLLRGRKGRKERGRQGKGAEGREGRKEKGRGRERGTPVFFFHKSDTENNRPAL